MPDPPEPGTASGDAPEDPSAPAAPTNTAGGPTSVTASAGPVLPKFLLDRDVFADPSKTPAPTLAPIVLVSPPKPPGNAPAAPPQPDPPWDMIELFPITFGGKPLGGSQVFSIADGGKGDYVLESTSPRKAAGTVRRGVRRDMAERLIEAEQQIYQFLSDTNGGAELSEGELDGQMGIGGLGAYQFRPGLHAFGTAVDLDVSLNPYIPTRKGSLFGGEAHREFTLAQRADFIFRPVVEVYDRACELVYGKGTTADAHWNDPGDKETAFDAFLRFEKIDLALKWMLRLCYTPISANLNLLEDGTFNGAKAPPMPRHDPVPLAEFAQRLRERWDQDPAFQKLHPELASGIKDPTGAPLASLYQTIIADHATLRLGWVRNSPTPVMTGTGKAAVMTGAVAKVSRDPCNGFLGLRPWVVSVLRDKQRLRWGLVDFGSESGDVMHFDLGQKEGLSRDHPLVKRLTAAQQREFFTVAGPPVIRAASVKERPKQPKVTVAAGTTTTDAIDVSAGQTLVVELVQPNENAVLERRPSADQPWLTINNTRSVGRTREWKIPDDLAGQAMLVRVRNALPSGPSLEELRVNVAAA